MKTTIEVSYNIDFMSGEIQFVNAERLLQAARAKVASRVAQCATCERYFVRQVSNQKYCKSECREG